MWQMSRKLTIVALDLAMLVGCGGIARAGGGGSLPATSQLQRATSGVQALQGWYNQSTGLYNTTGWWNSANALTVLVDYARVSNSTRYTSVIQNTLTAAQVSRHGSSGFINKFYDDEGWWALAWIDAYDLTKDPQYLFMARSIFGDMANGWDETCGGGIWWSKDRQYKNAIANELFLSVAAHLANRVDASQQTQYLNWANKEWTWFAASGMINAKNLINDGLTITTSQTGTTCTNNGKNTWSYNQGVVLGGLTELSKANPCPSLPLVAKKIATSATTSLVDTNGIMHDICEPNCGADGVQFKGIFVRNLVALDHAYPQVAYKTFIETNADAIWNKSQGPNFQFGQVWSGPFDAGKAGSQSSALDAIVGAAVVDSAK